MIRKSSDIVRSGSLFCTVAVCVEINGHHLLLRATLQSISYLPPHPSAVFAPSRLFSKRRTEDLLVSALPAALLGKRVMLRWCAAVPFYRATLGDCAVGSPLLSLDVLASAFLSLVLSGRLIGCHHTPALSGFPTSRRSAPLPTRNPHRQHSFIPFPWGKLVRAIANSCSVVDRIPLLASFRMSMVRPEYNQFGSRLLVQFLCHKSARCKWSFHTFLAETAWVVCRNLIASRIHLSCYLRFPSRDLGKCRCSRNSPFHYFWPPANVSSHIFQPSHMVSVG